MNLNAKRQEIQSEILCLLKELDRVCRKNKIEYTLHGGTLLGGIRHKGFIPWDDDADVAFTRENYEKLIECFNKESADFLLIESYLHMPRVIRRNYNENSVFSWVDIFVYDSISENALVKKMKMGGVLLFQAMCRDSNTIRLLEGKGHGASKMTLFKMAYQFGRLFSYERKYNWYNKFCKKWFNGSGKTVFRSNDHFKGMKLTIPEQYVRDYIDIAFEDTMLMVTSNYHEVLVNCYGDNYMVPIHDGGNDDIHVKFRNAFLKHLNINVE